MDKELEQLQEQEQFDTKYMNDLLEYWNAYSYALINEIFTGVAINLGMSEKEAYKLAKSRPEELKKAKFFQGIFDKFKTIFKHKVPKFRYKKKLYGTGEPMTPEQWDKFNASLTKFWQDNATKVSEDIATKAHALGAQTTNFREKKKSYQNKSLHQINFEQYDGKMPDNLAEAYKKYDFTNSEKKALNKQLSSIGMYIRQTNNEIQEAIRNQIETGIDNNKSPIEVASDLYWKVEKNEKLVNKDTAEEIRRNWNKISSTEMATVYESRVLAPYESDAMRSIKDPEKAKYFVFTGGSCPWCRAHQGTLVRLVPASVVTDTRNDSLKSMGIKDPNTDIAIWIGKNNVGFKETKNIHEWRVCTPAHPYNKATMQPIDLKTEWYNPKSGDIELKQKKQKFIPTQVDYSQKTKEEKEWRKPTEIGNNLVRYNNNIYEAVPANRYNEKLEAYRKDPQLPIPVNESSPGYRRIFEAAKKE